MRAIKYLLIIIGLCLLTFSAEARDFTADRAMFRQATLALKQDRDLEFQLLSNRLQDYPLYPYLRYDYITQHIAAASPIDIITFLNQYSDTPLAAKLRNAWLAQLADKEQWGAFLKFYQDTSDRETQCRYGQALLATGADSAAAPVLTKLWLNDAVDPAACSSAFQLWIKHGGLSTDLVWQRMQLAMDDDNKVLFNKLLVLLPKEQMPDAQLWPKIHTQPNLIYQNGLPTPLNEHTKLIILDAIAKLAKKDPRTFVSTWPNLQKQYIFNDADKQAVFQDVGIALARLMDPTALQWLMQITPEHETTIIREWRIRVLLVQNNWSAVSAWINKMPVDERNTPCWQYWLARALEQQGDSDIAHAMYRSLATSGDYYALLANQHLGVSFQPKVNNDLIAPEAYAQIINIPAVQRARELYALQRPIDSRREWQWAIKQMSPAQLSIAARLANDWQWYDRAVLTEQRLGGQYDYNILFPLAYRDQVLFSAKQSGIDPAWVFAIMHQESAFMFDAKSSVGALGLMQLMPQTAKLIAEHLYFNWHTKSKKLLDVDVNVQLGCSYFKDLLKTFNGDYLQATAAYNAGPTRVKRLSGFRQTLPTDIWVEILPWQETRTYVKKVSLAAMNYQWQLKQQDGTVVGVK